MDGWNRWLRLPCLSSFKPRPVGFAGRCTTSIDSMRPGASRCAWSSFRSEAMLKSSEPQKRMRRGSGVVVEGEEEE